MAFNVTWDAVGEHFYETGTDRGMLYVYDKNAANAYDPDFKFGTGVAWSGLTGVTQSPEGAEANDFYADNGKYLSVRSAETFGATITAYQSPDEFDACDGSVEVLPGFKLGQQTRKAFCFAYRTLLGNDTEGNDHGYKLHIIYNATASPSDRDYTTVNDSNEPIEMSWEIDTTAIDPKITITSGGTTTTFKPVAHIELNSLEVASAKLTQIENVLYGTANTAAEGETSNAVAPRCPSPAEIYSILSAAG